jgi:hypothetical protein
MLDTIRIDAEAPNIDYILYHTSWGWGPSRSGMPDIVEAATTQGDKLGELEAEIGKPIVCVARTPTSGPGMDATIAFQERCAAQGLAVYASVAAAALALQRLFTWQSQREEFAPAK